MSTAVRTSNLAWLPDCFFSCWTDCTHGELEANGWNIISLV